MTFEVNSSSVGRLPQVIQYTDQVADKKDTQNDVQKNSQNNTIKGGIIGSGLTALAALGLYLVTKGKAEKVVEKVEKPIEQIIEQAAKNTKTAEVGEKAGKAIEQTEKNIEAAEARFARNEARSVTTDRKVVEHIETSNANASNRKLVEEALRDNPTEADVKTFQEQIAYQPAKAKDVAAAKKKGVKFVEQECANATQKLADAKGAEQLEKMAENLESATQGIKDGKYLVEYAPNKNGLYTVKDGKIVDAQVDDMSGKITEIKLAKHYDKYNILEQIANGGSNVVRE